MDVQTGVIDRLTDLLTARGTTINWLATEMGVYQSTLSRQVSNKALTPEHIVSAAGVLGVSPGWLLTGEGDMKKPAPPGLAERAIEEIQAVLARYGGDAESTLATPAPSASAPAERNLEELSALARQERERRASAGEPEPAPTRRGEIRPPESERTDS